MVLAQPTDRVAGAGFPSNRQDSSMSTEVRIQCLGGRRSKFVSKRRVKEGTNSY